METIAEDVEGGWNTPKGRKSSFLDGPSAGWKFGLNDSESSGLCVYIDVQQREVVWERSEVLFGFSFFSPKMNIAFFVAYITISSISFFSLNYSVPDLKPI